MVIGDTIQTVGIGVDVDIHYRLQDADIYTLHKHSMYKSVFRILILEAPKSKTTSGNMFTCIDIFMKINFMNQNSIIIKPQTI